MSVTKTKQREKNIEKNVQKSIHTATMAPIIIEQCKRRKSEQERERDRETVKSMWHRHMFKSIAKWVETFFHSFFSFVFIYVDKMVLFCFLPLLLKIRKQSESNATITSCE